jgi:hypothetical protein
VTDAATHIPGTESAGQSSGAPHPFFSGPVRYTAEQRPLDDEAATAQTIGRMREYATADSVSPIVRRAAYAAIGDERDARRQAERVFHWIQRRVRFVEDAELVRGLSGTADEDEVLVRPVDLLTMPQPCGDCDDFSMLCAAMLRALGIASEFITVAADRSAADMYSHVYVCAQLPGGPLALDTSHGRYPGWEVPRAGKIRNWSLETMRSNLHGVRALGDGEDGGGIDWGSIIQTSVNQAGGVLKVALTPPGTYISGPQGTTYRAPTGTSAASALSIPGFSSASLSGNTLLLIGGVLLAVLLISRKG